MSGGGWSEFLASRKPGGTPHGEHGASQRWMEQRRKRAASGFGNADVVRPFPEVTRDMIRAKSARAAARCADRRLSSRGSSVGSRPFTAPSEPASSRPATSESKQSRKMKSSARGAPSQRHMPFASGLEWGFNPEPEIDVGREIEPEIEEEWSWNCHPHMHPEVIRLNRRPANACVRYVKVLANGNRLECMREGDESRKESQLPKTPPPTEDATEDAPAAVPERYQCIAEPGAIVRSGIELTTEQTGVIYSGEMVVVLDQRFSSTGVSRVRCDRGWVSVKASNGRPVLVPAADTLHVDGDRGKTGVPSPPQGAVRWSQRARPPTGGSTNRLQQRSNRPRVPAGAGNASCYPKMPAGTLGFSAGHVRRQQQLEERRRAKPPSGRKSVSSIALQGEGVGPVVRGGQWQRVIRKLNHIDPTTGAATAVRPAVGVASEIEAEEKRVKGSVMFFDAAVQGSKLSQAAGLMLWARKGHVSSTPASTFGAAAAAGRVGVHFRETAWQSPDLFFQKIQDVVEEAEEASRARERHKARKTMQAQLDRAAARKIWVRGEQVELKPTPPM